jgi:pimeloyl-ACP methyl ester carboxylesterase
MESALRSAETSGSPKWPRWWRGSLCTLTFLVAPLGWFLRGGYVRQAGPERLSHGLVLILPGIEGRSFLNIAVLQGLVDAGLPYAIEIVDWTTGFKPLALYHLRSWNRNRRQAADIAQRIVRYRQQYPDRPVWIVGHSGGGGMALLTAEALPAATRLTGIVLLAAAVSRRFDLRPALNRVERGIWSFHSALDWFFVGLGTTVFGSMDGVHGPSAGMLGFSETAARSTDDPHTTDAWSPPSPSSGGVFRQHGYAPWMIKQFHLGGHFGCVHRVFIAETIAPLLSAEVPPSQHGAGSEEVPKPPEIPETLSHLAG